MRWMSVNPNPVAMNPVLGSNREVIRNPRSLLMAVTEKERVRVMPMYNGMARRLDWRQR